MTTTSTSSSQAALGDYVLTLACPDQPGIVARRHLVPARSRRQHPRDPAVGDREHGRFLLRIGFETADGRPSPTRWSAFETMPSSSA